MISNIYRDCFAQLSYEAVRDSGQPFLCFFPSILDFSPEE